MTANQAARHQLRLTEDRIKPDVGYACPLPALNRVLYVLRGHLTVKIGGKDLRTSENHARFSTGEVEAAAGPNGATVLRYELVTAGAPSVNGGPDVGSTMLLETPITLERSESYLMRCDRVDFAPGGIAPLHRHKGGGIRCLIAGGLEVRVGDHADVQARPGVVRERPRAGLRGGLTQRPDGIHPRLRLSARHPGPALADFRGPCGYGPFQGQLRAVILR
jgi:hypothetical protein